MKKKKTKEKKRKCLSKKRKNRARRYICSWLCSKERKKDDVPSPGWGVYLGSKAGPTLDFYCLARPQPVWGIYPGRMTGPALVFFCLASHPDFSCLTFSLPPSCRNLIPLLFLCYVSLVTSSPAYLSAPLLLPRLCSRQSIFPSTYLSVLQSIITAAPFRRFCSLTLGASRPFLYYSGFPCKPQGYFSPVTTTTTTSVGLSR